MGTPLIRLPLAEVAERYRAGESTRVIAQSYGVSHHLVRRRLSELEIERRPRAARLTLPVSEIAARYEAGENIVELGAAYGVCQATVRDRLLGARVEMRNPAWHRKRGGPLCSDRQGYLKTYDREGRCALLHRGCWEAHNGAIPSGHAIHHINRNVRDNRIENLACMTHAAHAAWHRRQAISVQCESVEES